MATGDPMPVDQLGSPAQDIPYTYGAKYAGVDFGVGANSSDTLTYATLAEAQTDLINAKRKADNQRMFDERARFLQQAQVNATQITMNQNSPGLQGISSGSSTGDWNIFGQPTTTFPTQPYQPYTYQQDSNLTLLQNQVNELQQEIIRKNNETLQLRLELEAIKKENEELKKTIPYKEPGRMLDV